MESDDYVPEESGWKVTVTGEAQFHGPHVTSGVLVRDPVEEARHISLGGIYVAWRRGEDLNVAVPRIFAHHDEMLRRIRGERE